MPVRGLYPPPASPWRRSGTGALGARRVVRVARGGPASFRGSPRRSPGAWRARGLPVRLMGGPARRDQRDRRERRVEEEVIYNKLKLVLQIK